MRVPTPDNDAEKSKAGALAMVDDNPLVAPIPTEDYARAGRLTRARAGGVTLLRALRLPLSLGATALPTMVLAVLMMAIVDPSLAARPSSDSELWLEPLATSPRLAMTAFAGTIAAILFGGAAISVLDTIIWGRLRDAAGTGHRAVSTMLRQSGWGFVGVTLVRFAMYASILMFLSPLLRAGVQAAQRGATPGLTIGVEIAITTAIVVTLGWLRFALASCSAWMAWRPRFFMGALVAGIVAPWRRASLYGAVGLRWFPAFIIEQVLGASLILYVLAPELVPGLGASYVSLFIVIVAFSFARRTGVWLDATLVAIVGHQLGELDLARIGRENVAMATQPGNARLRQYPFEPPVRGVYVGATPDSTSPTPRSIVTFERLLGYGPAQRSAAPWVLPSTLLEPGGDLEATRGGLLELPTRAAPGADTTAAVPSLAISAHETLQASRPAPMPEGGPSTFAELEAQLERAVVRTSGGAPEVRWRAQR
jgi:hypothetical protein